MRKNGQNEQKRYGLGKSEASGPFHIFKLINKDLSMHIFLAQKKKKQQKGYK